MLLRRVLTASVLIPLVLLAVLKLPIDYFALVFGLITLLAAWEWTQLTGIQETKNKTLFYIGLVFPMLFIHFWTQFLEGSQYLIETGQQGIYQSAKNSGWTSISSLMEYLSIPDIRYYSAILETLVIPPVIFWIMVMALLRNAPGQLLNLQIKKRYKALIGIFVLLMAWMFFVRLRALYPPELTLYLLILIWTADITAYFAGKKFGKTQLAPEISPGKTLAGFYAALGSAVICGIGLGLIYGYQPMMIADLALLSLLTVLVSIYGDLFFSLAKRQSGLKDSSNLLPGHGGILDRIDSLVAAIPFFYGGIYMIHRMVE
jgi:phosphatidate cytidylyltransferase